MARQWWMAVGMLCAGACAVTPAERLARVASGELKEAHASWWGFDPSDSTRALQAAIDSRVPRLIVDNTGAPWIADRLRLVSDQEIVFEKGVEVLAKKDAFRGKGDSLFSLVGVTNVTLRGYGATLRMRRADYDAPPYAKAEWRHVLNIKSSERVRVFGLTLAESGGDGIYLGCLRSGLPNRDVLIKDVLCDKNYRQGISVISCEDLLIENTVMRDTAGTAPAAGIDFEPNGCGERLKNCVMRGCVTQNNQGDGYDFYLPNLTRDSEPVAIRLENCRSTGDRVGVMITTGNSDEKAVRGTMALSDCRFERARRTGIGVSCKPAFGLSLSFDRCAVDGCSAGQPKTSDIQLANRKEDEWPVGCIRMRDVTVVQPCERPWISWQIGSLECDTVTGLTGLVAVERDGVRRTVALTPEWARATFPPRFSVRVPRVAADLSRMRVTDRVGGVQALEPLRLRRAGTYVCYAKAGTEVRLVGRHSQVGRYASGTKPLVVRAPSGRVAASVPLPPFGARAETGWTAAESGFYTLDVDVGANAFALLEANVPVALDATKKAVGLIASTGTLAVAVPRDIRVFAVGVAGEGDTEAVRVTVIAPDGHVAWAKDGIAQRERFTVSDAGGVADGVWLVKCEKPSSGVFEDFCVEALGVPGYLFLNRNRFWEAE